MERELSGEEMAFQEDGNFSSDSLTPTHRRNHLFHDSGRSFGPGTFHPHQRLKISQAQPRIYCLDCIITFPGGLNRLALPPSLFFTKTTWIISQQGRKRDTPTLENSHCAIIAIAWTAADNRSELWIPQRSLNPGVLSG